MNVASIAAAVEAVGGHPVSAQTIRRTLHQIGLHGCRPRKKPLLKIMHKKAINRIQNTFVCVLYMIMYKYIHIYIFKEMYMHVTCPARLLPSGTQTLDLLH